MVVLHGSIAPKKQAYIWSSVKWMRIDSAEMSHHSIYGHGDGVETLLYHVNDQHICSMKIKLHV